MPSSARSSEFPEFDNGTHAALLAYHADLAKPQGSLGRLEEIAAFYAGAHGLMPPPPPELPTLVVFAADHGITADGVSAYPSAVTAAVVLNVMCGGSAINALCTSNRIHLRLIDVGISGNLSAAPQQPVVALESRKVGSGTQSFAHGPAMSLAQARAALRVGEEVAAEAILAGAKLLGVGEIGIGNTACASALISVVTGVPPKSVVGPGAGLDAAGVVRKVSVVQNALARYAQANPPPNSEGELSALTLLGELGGFEVAAMVGFLLEAARRRTPVVLDGVVTAAAALVAVEWVPQVRHFLLASHGSTEPGAAVVDKRLALVPLLDFSMRLGEGSGAALGLSLLRTAVDVTLQMSTLDAAIERAGLSVRER